MPVYNKLVRDRILEMIQADNKEYNAKTLSNEDYILELKKKLFEEVEEVKVADHRDELVGELADVLELIHALLQVHEISFKQLEEVRLEKKKERGGFDKKLFLIDVED